MMKVNNKNTKSKMKEIFIDSGFNLSEHQLDLFWIYYNLLIKYNDEFDLTRLKKFEDIVIKHFIDSIYITKLFDIPTPLLDIGTGAGFPGIPLKIILPQTGIILAEPRHRRVSFLNMAIGELDLKDIEVYPHTVNEYSHFDVRGVITRALESIDKTLSRINHFLSIDDKIIFMKGPGAEADVENISQSNTVDFDLMHDKNYFLPNTNNERRIIIYRKNKKKLIQTYKILIKDNQANSMTTITSSENQQFKKFKKLLSSDGMKKNNQVIISGRKLVTDFLNSFVDIVNSIILYDGYFEQDDIINESIKRFATNGKSYILKKNIYNELDVFNTNYPLLICRIPDIPQWDYRLDAGCNLLIPFQDPANVGTVIRSAVAFGVKRIILLKESANPYHPKSVRASGGAVFHANFFYGPSIADIHDLCKDGSLNIFSLDKAGKPINSIEFPERFLLLSGIEGPGIPAELKHSSISIPIIDGLESLNAAVAASIAIYEWKNRYAAKL